MAERQEPTRDQIAKDYALALVIINDLSARNAELLDVLRRSAEFWSTYSVVNEPAQDDLQPEADALLAEMGAALAKAEGRS